MPTNDPPSLMPDDSVTGSDGGDETASRYRFQHTWAAIVCCALLDKTQDVEEVYCEHHEDVLIKYTDGTYSGHQVKTRGDTQPLWKAHDPQVKVACRRFVQLEEKYSQTFRSFCFLTNHPLHTTNTTASLIYVLKQIAEATTPDELKNPVKKWLARLATKSNASEIVAFRALKKTTASSELPKLRDAMTRLIQTLAYCWDHASECTLEAIGRAARGLVDECARASALDDRQLLPTYLLPTHHPELANAARLQGKRMTVERVQRALHDGIASTATLWVRPNYVPN